MPRTLRCSILGGIIAALVVTQTGCAGLRVSPPRLDDAARSSLGTVAVRWVEGPPRVRVYSTYTAGRGAAAGAGTGAKVGLPLLAVGQVPHIAGAVVGIAGLGMSLAGALIGAPIGAIVGATKAPPKAAVKSVEAAFVAHAVPLDLGGCLGGHIHQTLRQGTSTWSIFALGPPSAPGDDAGRHRALAGQGVDTVLDLGTVTLEASGPFGINPEGALILTVPMRLVRAGDGAELLAHQFRWAQGGPGFADWPADAPRFGEALERGCVDLARDIVRAVVGDVEPVGLASEPDDNPVAQPTE